MVIYEKLLDHNDSDYDDGGFMSDEMDENKSNLTPRKSNMDDRSVNIEPFGNGMMNISRISRFENNQRPPLATSVNNSFVSGINK